MSINGHSILCTRLSHISADNPVIPRVLGLYAAAVALSDEPALTAAVEVGRNRAVKRTAFYELTLQSYLFLGFPRMLIAMEHLARIWPESNETSEPSRIDALEVSNWFARGLTLCTAVYGDAFEPLKAKVLKMSPEAFQWMIVEGYGKVLSRPGLGRVERELGNVAFLMVENCESQLHSHMRGALRVGTSPELLKTVIDDVGEAAGDGFLAARTLLARIGID